MEFISPHTKAGRIPAFITLLAVLFYGYSADANWYSDTRSIMGTSVSVMFWSDDADTAEKVIFEAMEEMQRIDQSLSPYIDSSELATLNRLAAKKPQMVSKEMLTLVDKSLYFSRISGGAFDITFASVGWYYDYRNKKQPSELKREELLPAINYRLLQLDKKNETIRYGHKNIRIDLGGIAKGYAVDLVTNIFKKNGIKSATVSAGGDSRILGDKRGKPWIIGIKNPRGKSQKPAITLPLSDVAVSTSGDYERYFIDTETGERIHHIINPRTGKSTYGVSSVTIIGPNGIDTDPMSTTVFVLGVNEGMKLVNSIPGYDCIIIDSAGKVHYSSGLVTP